MAIQTGTFLSLTGKKDYAINTKRSTEQGINFINDLGKVKFVNPKVDELLVNNPEDGHALGIVS